MNTRDIKPFDLNAVRLLCNELQSLVWSACQEAKTTKIQPAARAIFEAIRNRAEDLNQAIGLHSDVDTVNDVQEPCWQLEELAFCAATATGDGHDLSALEQLFLLVLNDVRDRIGLQPHGCGAIEADPEDIYIPGEEVADDGHELDEDKRDVAGVIALFDRPAGERVSAASFAPSMNIEQRRRVAVELRRIADELCGSEAQEVHA